MKTLERQLAEYGDYQKELHGPIAASEFTVLATTDVPESSRSTKGLWIAFTAAAVVILVVLIPWLLRSEGVPPVISPEPSLITVPEPSVTTVPEPPVNTLLDVDDPSVDWVRLDDATMTDLAGLGFVRSAAYVDSRFVIPPEYCDASVCDWLVSDDGLEWVREPLPITPPAIGQYVAWVDSGELWLFQQTGWKREGDAVRQTSPNDLQILHNDGSRWLETSQSLPEQVLLYFQDRVVSGEDLRRVTVGGELGVGGSNAPVFSDTTSVIPMNGSPEGENPAGGNAYWLAVGQNGQYSNISHPDIGPEKYPVQPAGFLNGVLYGNAFEERRQAGSVWRLEDDSTWTQLAADPELLGLVNEFYIVNERAFINEVGDVMSDGGRLPSPTVWTSEDLVSWTKTEGLRSGRRISATDFGWISEAGSVSSDGIRWQDIDPPETREYYTVSYVNGLFFFIGSDGFETTSVWMGRSTNE